jgi:glycosyltransferase involved in cell wall biosynthesis
MTASSELRVVHVLAPAREGGLERVVQMLASAQGARAHVIAVMTPSEAPAHPFVADLKRRGVTVHEVVVPARGYLSEYRLLRRLFRTLEPDIVHTHGYRPDIIAGLAAGRAKVPCVSTVHGFLGGGARNRFNERLQIHALRRAQGVIPVSGPLVERLAAAGVPAARMHLVRNAYAPSAPIVPRDEARARLGIPGDALVAGWVGRLSPEKGPDVMLRALALAPAPWRVSLVGDGRTRPELEGLAASLGVADRVTWHGLVPQGGSLLRAFDAFVLSSRTEGTPIVLLEAMASNVPVVATRVGGVPDVVTEGEALLVPPEDPAAIAAALVSVRENAGDARARASQAAARVESEFGVAEWVAAVDRVYGAALRETSGR